MAEQQKKIITKQFILNHLEEQEVDLSLCYLNTVPVKELVSVNRFRKLDLSQNKITELPESFINLKFVTAIDLSKNQLTCLPENFGELIQLQKLDVFGNELSNLPFSFFKLKQLKWLDVRANQLEPKLVAVAGDCSSEKECKECAINIVKYMQDRHCEIETKEKKTADKKKVKDKRKEKKRQNAQAESKKQKEESKLKRRVVWEEQQQQKEEDGNKDIDSDNKDNLSLNSLASSGSSFEDNIMRFLIILLIILISCFVSLVMVFWDEINSVLVHNNFYQTFLTN